MAVSYDCPATGNAHLLVFHQVLHVPTLKHNLLCPMQMRHAGVTLNDTPRHCLPEPTSDDHCLMAGGLKIPLELDGVTSVFHTRTPTAEELQAYPDGDYIECTAQYPEWDPQSDLFKILESRFKDLDMDGGRSPNVERRRHPRQLFACLTNRRLDDPFDIQRTVSAVKPQVKLTTANAEQLAKTWRISPAIAERTLRTTTQKGVREYDGKTGNVERRYPTGDRPLRYKQLSHRVFHDTLFAPIRSSRGNKCAELYGTGFGWSRVFPMKSKSDAHYTLDEFLHRYGAPQCLVSDNAKELTQGEFAKKCREAKVPVDVTVE
mmetsp:Transcript_19047/g.46019  ORF Transcript_19047/g.46019 Transcript_19047/m.46019 type:complete len:319 (-) Transcript_19047:423-1379(-)